MMSEFAKDSCGISSDDSLRGTEFHGNGRLINTKNKSVDKKKSGEDFSLESVLVYCDGSDGYPDAICKSISMYDVLKKILDNESAKIDWLLRFTKSSDVSMADIFSVMEFLSHESAFSKSMPNIYKGQILEDFSRAHKKFDAAIASAYEENMKDARPDLTKLFDAAISFCEAQQNYFKMLNTQVAVHLGMEMEKLKNLQEKFSPPSNKTKWPLIEQKNNGGGFFHNIAKKVKERNNCVLQEEQKRFGVK